jgi:selenocysteine-specific elongation factor
MAGSPEKTVAPSHGPSRPIILGTAGHIDHGKTLLIKLLSGIDTDRLAEEKKRGISIELGFASIETPSGHQLGVVDVPGHERFIKTMLAGAAGIDLILFVIAADEGTMPQTREHMEILQFLGINKGIVVLTKTDLVDSEWLELVTEEVKDYLESTPLAGAPIIPISSLTGQGKEELFQALDELIPEIGLEERGRITRLPIDRAFVMEGFGTVVTGTLWAGHINEGDQVRILPKGIQSRIKALEVHNHRVKRALAGQRTAVALHAVEKEKLARGDWLTTRDDVEPIRMVNATIHCLPSSPRPLQNGSRIRFHLGAAEILGRLILLEGDELGPGKEGWAQIRLEQSTLAERGDHFVIRTYSPARTIAGGRIALAENRRRRRFRKDDLEALRVAEKGTPEERIQDRLGVRGALGFTFDELAREVGQPRGEVKDVVERLSDQGAVVPAGRDRVVSHRALEDSGAQLAAVLKEFQKKNPLHWGMTKSELKSRHSDRVHPDVVELWVRREMEAEHLFVRKDWLRWGEKELILPPALQNIREKMIQNLREVGFAGPNQKEFLERMTQGAAGPHQRRVPEMLSLLIEEGEVARIPPDILLHREVLDQVPALVREFFASGRKDMSVPQFKDILRVSRKQAVPLLEYMDRERMTVRSGDVRVPGPRLGEGFQ